MDVLAGARNERHLRSLRGLFARATVLPTGPADYHEAAALYRACRREGETVRKLVDCLIGSIAIRAGAAVLHNDNDFDVLARHTGLQSYIIAMKYSSNSPIIFFDSAICLTLWGLILLTLVGPALYRRRFAPKYTPSLAE